MNSQGFSYSLLKLLVWCWCLASMFFLTYGLSPDETFLLGLRVQRWYALNIVGVSVALATFVFQVVVQNRILTPSIVGLDSVYLLLNICLLGVLGATGFNGLSANLMFGINTLIMVLFALGLFSVLLRKFQRDIGRLLLMGIVIGMFTQTLTEFVARLLSPESFAAFQGVAFARFDDVNTQLTVIAAVVLVAICISLWRLRFVMDIYRLSHVQVVNLGIPFVLMTSILLMIVALLVSLSTALVGPIFFFGLLVVATVNGLMPNASSGAAMFTCAVLGALILVGGQGIFEHAFAMKATLSVVVELVGGLVFLGLLVTRVRE